MKFEPIVCVSVCALALVGVVVSADAQSSAAAPTKANVARSDFPGDVPEGWKAAGWSQSDWIALYRQCLNIPAETTRRSHMNPEQLKGLKPIPGDWEGCKHIFGSVGTRPQASSASATNLAIKPTPMPTPLPAGPRSPNAMAHPDPD
jgi:hypothetical protein